MKRKLMEEDAEDEDDGTGLLDRGNFSVNLLIFFGWVGWGRPF